VAEAIQFSKGESSAWARVAVFGRPSGTQASWVSGPGDKSPGYCLSYVPPGRRTIPRSPYLRAILTCPLMLFSSEIDLPLFIFIGYFLSVSDGGVDP
jgi:hypothetical protein